MTETEKKGPPTLEQLEVEGKLPWKSPGEPQPYLDAQVLFGHVKGFFETFVDLQDPRYYDVLAAWAMHTWHFQKFRATGPLYLLGPISSGKTTVLECLEEIAYRGIRGGQMSNATMFRLSHAHEPTLLVDESQLYNREEWEETRAFLNERYRKGGRVWRMEGEGKNMIPVFFNAYGPTAFAGSSPPWDAMMSRAILVKMEKGKPAEQTLTDLFYETGKRLRGQLLAYSQMFRLSREKGEFESEVDAAEQFLIEEGKLEPRRPDLFPDPTPELEASVKDYRVREIGYPLMAVAPTGEPRNKILSYLRDLEADHTAEEQSSYLAEYVHALDIAQKEEGKVSAREIRLQLAGLWGLKTDSKELPRPRTVMAALRTLGFHISRVGHESLTGILWDEPLMARLRVRYAPVSSGSPASPA